MPIYFTLNDVYLLTLTHVHISLKLTLCAFKCHFRKFFNNLQLCDFRRPAACHNNAVGMYALLVAPSTAIVHNLTPPPALPL